MAIGSHIIPRFYLEQFANPPKRKGKPGNIWTYEKGKPTHLRSTRSQGYQNGALKSGHGCLQNLQPKFFNVNFSSGNICVERVKSE
jgi:hypothetical protein